MSKIFYKVNGKNEKSDAEKTAPDQTRAADEISNSVDVTETKTEAKDKEQFNKEKIIKYFKRHPKKTASGKVDRFSPKLNKGLSSTQVQTRFTQFLFNDTNKKYSRSYASIFIGNICTFFNLLCLLAGIALIIAYTKGITNYLVIIITTANIVIGIIQEIRSKRSIDKLSILAANTVKVIRDGEVTEIPVTEIVLDDVLILELGNQVPADCILAEGSVEVNESLLTGESVPIKKSVGDTLRVALFQAETENSGWKKSVRKLTLKSFPQRQKNISAPIPSL